jgi:hypothetical protein
LKIVIVHLVAECGFADLIEALELVEADRQAVRHDQSMEYDGKALLAKRLNFLRFAEDLGARRNERMLPVV